MGIGALGNRANATIGRAVRLVVLTLEAPFRVVLSGQPSEIR